MTRLRILPAAFVLAALALPAEAAKLTVTVEGVRDAKGNVELSIFDNASEWPEHPSASHHKVEPAKGGSVVFTFDLPPGTYAAAGYHDENGDGKFNKSMIGLPEEGYSISNSEGTLLSAPSFKDSSFQLPASGAAVTMKMVY